MKESCQKTGKVDKGEWERDVLQPNNTKEKFLEQAEKTGKRYGREGVTAIKKRDREASWQLSYNHQAHKKLILSIWLNETLIVPFCWDFALRPYLYASGLSEFPLNIETSTIVGNASPKPFHFLETHIVRPLNHRYIFEEL